MKYPVDLHTHTTSSDGQYSPKDLVKKAKESGILYLSVTDHDTIAGLDEALIAGKEFFVNIITGVELGAADDKNLHILGLDFDKDNIVLLELCQKMKESRDVRKYKIVDFLKQKGLEISLEEVQDIAGGDIVARGHFAMAMVKKEYVKTVREAFDNYLDTDEYQSIERTKADAKTCIETIKNAGGKAIVAHPYQLNYSDERLEELLKTLKGYGLDGLECHYPKHTKEQEEFYLSLAKKHGLKVTAGSDFHGEKIKPDITLAPTELDIDWLITK